VKRALLAAPLLAAGCGNSDRDRQASDGQRAEVAAAIPAAAAPTVSRRRGALVRARQSSYGRTLVDRKGRTLYLFTRDSTPRSRCYGDCATAWPPLFTKARPRAGDGARATRLGTTRRRGGAHQVTYRDHPLYYFAGDRSPGEINCQAVPEFGGIWYIVRPSGRAVR